ncbi:DUF535 family protein [Spirosoma radiotolerans]|uniref:DUF535 domain-containing protein n=1 Tax=Spirosoma radiotolerans TaxID=1379870 RepID=A0A0E3ZSW5_9BACT|nr:DUF535 family protein [Spirosoma radiotolerans]AKD54310.1 hypothetical protein SD10_04675 [Spirosoma radiotolerans]
MKLFTGPVSLAAHLLTYTRSIKSTTLYRVTNQVARRGVLYTLKTGFRFRRIIWHAQRHRYLAKLLKTSPQVITLSQENPRLLYKYLGQYLALDLPTKDKLAMLTSHYHYFTKYVRPHFFDDVLHKTYIWQDWQGDDSFRIGLFFPVGLDWEGELAVVLEYNTIPVYTIRFTVVADQLTNSLFGESIFVGGIQGIKNPDLVKQATKTLFDITPAALLMASLQGIAQACSLKCIWGAGNERQLANGAAFFNYDAFWDALGGQKQPCQLYTLSIPFPEKPITSIKANHRSRTLRKREYKHKVTQQVRAHFEIQLR